MPTCLEKNRAALEACRPDLLPYGQGAEKSEHQVVLARTGLPVLLKETRHGLLSLHSRIDPEKEAADLIGRLELEPGRILVILGLGLGYHLDALLPKLPPDYPVVVIESEAETFEAALRLKDLSAALERPGLEILVGTSPGQAIERIDRIRFKQGLPSPLVLVHPPSVRSRPDYYHPIREALEASASSPLAGRLLRPRLKTDRLGVLLLDTGYHLIRETEAAARSLGHRVHRLAVPGKGGARQETMSRLIHDIADFKPDFLLTVNHLGFDEGGVLADVLARLRLPFASWFVDSPGLILRRARGLDSEYGSIFVWDRDYVSEIQARGCRRVHYLPLAADESTFRALNGRPNPLARLACPVSFVGDSMVRPVDDKAARLGLPARAWPLIDRAARAFIDSPDLEPGRLLDRSELAEQNRDLPFGSSHRVDLEGLITWRATQIYRLERVKALAPLGPTVVGDEGWRRLLDEQLFTLAPPLDYYEQLPYFYPLSRVNFNATSRQMKNGLNQRVFDVPACGAFVLTDHQAQIEDLFEVGREVVCYQTPEEALDLARFYLAHEGARLEIAGNGRRRVLAHHTYRHRLDRLIRQMREDFAS